MIHNIHNSESDIPSAKDFAIKYHRTAREHKLKLVYAGRMIEMKGVFDWLQVIRLLKNSDVSFEAHWLGDGPLMNQARNFIDENSLEGYVTLHGYVSDRDSIKHILFDADALVFCHLQPESPRILIEALNQATPIVGYGSAYSEDLISNGGGILVPTGNFKALFKALDEFAKNSARRQQVIQRAYEVGKKFTDDKVFRHRASLIKENSYKRH